MKFAKLGKFKKYIMMIYNYLCTFKVRKKVNNFEIIVKKKFDSKTAIEIYEKAYAKKDSVIIRYNEIIISAEPNENLDELFLYFGKKFETESVCFNKIINSNCMYLLGYDYFYLNETAKNYEKALKWIKKSALLGNIQAIYSIGNTFNDKIYAEKCFENNIDYFEDNWIKIKEKSVDTNIKYLKGIRKNYKLNQLGEYYSNNKLITANYKKAIKYFKKAIKMKYTPAMNNLANCYFNGYGVVKNDEKAFKLLNKSAKSGNIDAIYEIAICYENGHGIAQNYKKAIKLYEKAIKSGNIKAQHRLKIIKNECDISKIKYIKGISNYIYKEANNNFFGKGVVQNYKKAFELYKKATELNNTNAMNCLGYCYKKGLGTELNYEKAFECYKKSADLGNSSAICNLGKMYYNGFGINKDIVMALALYEKSAGLGNGLAMILLGNHYYYVLNDYEKAIKLYEKAIKSGNIKAIKIINKIKYQDDISKIKYITEIKDVLYQDAYNIFLGKGVKQNYKRAFELYKKATEFNNIDAMNCLGYCYQKGFGTELNYEKAFECYKKSADLGNSSAICNLGKMYYNGFGVNKDIVMALALYEKSASLGNKWAMNYLHYHYAFIEEDYQKAKKWPVIKNNIGIIDITNNPEVIEWAKHEVRTRGIGKK